MAFVTETTKLERRLPAPIHSVLASLRVAWARHRTFTRTLNELNSLSPRELDDIGIAPGDIPAIARQEAAKI